MRPIKHFWSEMLSQYGTVSSKRFMGVVSMFVVLACILYLTVVSGPSPIVENLLETTLIISASLLGISNITNIWKGNKKLPEKKQEDNENNYENNK